MTAEQTLTMEERLTKLEREVELLTGRAKREPLEQSSAPAPVIPTRDKVRQAIVDFVATAWNRDCFPVALQQLNRHFGARSRVAGTTLIALLSELHDARVLYVKDTARGTRLVFPAAEYDKLDPTAAREYYYTGLSERQRKAHDELAAVFTNMQREKALVGDAEMARREQALLAQFAGDVEMRPGSAPSDTPRAPDSNAGSESNDSE